MQLNSNLNLNLSQELELMLAPRLIAMLKTLQLPYHELVLKLSEYAEENVMLEIEREDHLAEYLNFLASHKKEKKEADFTEMPGLKNINNRAESMDEYLIKQLKLLEIEEPFYSICEKLIENIDDQGYLLAYDQLKEKLKKELKTNDRTINEALEIIQSLEPDGIGARNLKECLLIQIREYNFESEALEKILNQTVKEYLEDLSQGNHKKIASALGITKEGVVQIQEFIKKNLNPHPGSIFGGEIEHLIPSFVVETEKDELKITSLEKQYGPILTLSNRYLKMLEDPKTDKETIEFLRNKHAAAKNILEQIQKRFETMQKTIEILAREQKGFFKKGKKWLKPFCQKNMAEELGVHPSTISRALADKYVQTPHGIFPLKMLCPRGEINQIKALIKETISKENKKSPLSDAQISEILEKEGVPLKRRTVSTYRHKLKLPNYQQRKQK